MDKKLNGLIFAEDFFLLKISHKIALIAVLEDKVEVIGGLLDVVQLNDVAIITGFEYFDLVFK